MSRDVQTQRRNEGAERGGIPEGGVLPSGAVEYVALRMPDAPAKGSTPEIEVTREKWQGLKAQLGLHSEYYQNWNAGSTSVLGIPERPSTELKQHLVRNLSAVLDIDPKNVSVRYEEQFRQAKLFIDVTREDGKTETLGLDLEFTGGKISGIAGITQSVRSPKQGIERVQEEFRALGTTLDDIGFVLKLTLERWNGVETPELSKEKAEVAEIYKAAFNAPPSAEVHIKPQADGSYQGRIELEGRVIASFTHDKEFRESEVLTLSDVRGIEKGRRAMTSFDVRLHDGLSDAELRDFGVSLTAANSYSLQLNLVDKRNIGRRLPLPAGTQRVEFSRDESDLKIQFIGKDQAVLTSISIGADRSRK